MALSRVTTWSANDVLTASALNGEFNNILNNPTSLMSPLVANIDAGNFQLTNLTLDNETTTFSSGSEGRVAYRTDINRIQTYDGSSSQILPLTGDGVFNWTFNGDVELWGDGAAAAPNGWTLVSGGSVAKNTTANQFKVGTASAAVTSAGGSATRLDQTISGFENFGPAARWGSKTVTLGCWVRATSASVARIHIYDGTTRTYSSYHTGGSSLEFLTVTATLQATPTEVTIGGEVAAGGAAAQFDGFVFVIGPTVLDYIPSGWRGRTFVISSTAGQILAGADGFLGGVAAAAEGEAYLTVPVNMVVRHIRTTASGAPSAGDTYTYTLRKGGVATSLAVTVSEADTLGSGTADVTFAAGNLISVEMVSSAGTPNAFHQFSLKCEETP